jgi:rhodanese-related sulfurtransferase
METNNPGATANRFVRNVLLETVLVGVVGALVAFASNALSPRGLKLTRNYSPGGALAASRSFGSASGTNGLAATQLLDTQFRAEGLQLATSNQVAMLFAEAQQAPGVIFVDARDDEHYQAGHIPGAYQLDRYHPENYLAVVLPACQVAEKIVVYCKGGSCEDSEQTAIFLRDAGVPKDRLFVYAGGFDEWSASRLPIETGQRNSGQLREPPPATSGNSGVSK